MERQTLREIEEFEAVLNLNKVAERQQVLYAAAKAAELAQLEAKAACNHAADLECQAAEAARPC